MKKLLLTMLLFPAIVQGQIITTISGNGTAANTGDGSPATGATIDYPLSGIFDRYGNYYFCTGSGGSTVRKIATNGIITTVAGTTGMTGFSGDGGAATAAKLVNPQAVAVDTTGNLYIADAYDNRIRKVDIATGTIITVAGNGYGGPTSGGFSGDGGPATAAMLNDPLSVAVDKRGNLYISDYNNNRIRKVVISTGIITTIAGTGAAGYNGDGGRADTSELRAPWGICTDQYNNLYIADGPNYRIRKVNTSGVITTVAGNGIFGEGGDGGPATNATISPSFVTVDNFGNIFLAGNGDGNNIVRVINTSGIITTVAGNGLAGFSGDGGPASASEIIPIKHQKLAYFLIVYKYG